MKLLISLSLLFLLSCGDDKEGERCRSAEEAQMKCQVDYAEKYEFYAIPDWVKEECQRYYRAPGCYLDSHSRHPGL